jgi:hypothetical protein
LDRVRCYSKLVLCLIGAKNWLGWISVVPRAERPAVHSFPLVG